jgi:CRISPR-associated protein Cas5h
MGMTERIKNLLIFDIKGRIAHFRKFYTNSSSLSYDFPPRTTITGLIAGLLGRQRDTYYEEFSSDKCRIALSIRTPTRKIMQTMNYIRTKSLAELNASAGHSQTPLEILLPLLFTSEIKYRIFSHHYDREGIMKDLREVLMSERPIYPPYLGLSEFIGKTNFVDHAEGNNIELHKSNESIEVTTVVNIERIKNRGLVFQDNANQVLQYVKEVMPLEFNKERRLKEKSSFIYEKNQRKAKLIIKDEYYKVNYEDPENGVLSENVVFMENVE